MKKFSILLFILIAQFGYSQKTPLKLWYKQPAGNTWENALPIGNGRLGAMIYGNVEKEIIQLNEHTVWSGGPNRNDNPQSLEKLAEIRKLIFEGNHKEAEKLANQAIITKTSHGQKFEPVGSLNLVFDGHENFTNYYRELDIERAISKTTYQVGDVVYTREAFASLADRVIVMKISSSKAGNVSFNANISSPQKRKTIATSPTKDLTISGTTSDHETVKGMVEYKGIARIKLEGGSLQSTDTSLIVKGANSATIFISIATNFNNYQDLNGDENNIRKGGGFEATGTNQLSSIGACYDSNFTNNYSAIFTVDNPINITIEPLTPAAFCSGTNVSLTAAANGADAYIWQEEISAGNWTNISGGSMNIAGETVSLTLTTLTTTKKVRCLFTNYGGINTVPTSEVTLVPVQTSITIQPVEAIDCYQNVVMKRLFQFVVLLMPISSILLIPILQMYQIRVQII